MHRVLCAPELLDLVFSFLEKQANANNARVCKKWLDPALDHIWRHVDALDALFSLISPLSKTPEYNPYKWELGPSPIGVDDWERFMPYGRRVRSLKFHDQAEQTKKKTLLSPSVFAEIFRTRTTLNILPNLVHLTWIIDNGKDVHNLTHITLFLQHSVKHLTISVPAALSAHLKDISARVPNLRILECISLEAPAHAVPESLALMLQNLPQLDTIMLPEQHATSQVISTASRLQRLTAFRYTSRGELEDETLFAARELHKSSFSSLVDMSFTTYFEEVKGFVNSLENASNLTHLHIHAAKPELPPTVREALISIADACTSLKTLHISLMLPQRHPYQEEEELLSFESIKPALSCKLLAEFVLTCDRRLSITDDDIDELAKSWPLMEVLLLNQDPVPLPAPDKPTITLRSLLSFARHCPELRTLGLYIDTSMVTLPENPPTFSKLDAFHPGTSPLLFADSDCAALYFSQIVPSNCNVVLGVRWPSFMQTDLDHLPEVAAIQPSTDQWGFIADSLPVLVAQHKAYKKLIRILEGRIEDLSGRVRELEEQLFVTNEVVLQE